jgi:hypothetical protein
MIGFNGGLIGKDRTTSLLSAPGVWSLSEQLKGTRGLLWPSTGDFYYNSVSLLLHGNGTSGSTTITDNSPTPKTVTANGNAQINTTVTDPFGTTGAGVIAFDGTGDYLTVPRDSSFLPVANEDFTVEAWIYLNQTPGATDAHIIGLGEYGTDSDYILLINSSRQVLFYFNTSPSATCLNTTVLALNAWHHIAASRIGTGANNMKVFANGSGTSFSVNLTTVATGDRALSIGADQNGDESNLNGYLSEIRITKGVGRYSANFSVPTEPFPNNL